MPGHEGVVILTTCPITARFVPCASFTHAAGRDQNSSMLIDTVRILQRVYNGLSGNFHDRGCSSQRNVVSAPSR